MKKIPNNRSELNSSIVFDLMKSNFKLISSHLYRLTTDWAIVAYKHFGDIDKCLILTYLVNEDFKFYRRNNINISYDLFYEQKGLEVYKISASQISRDLKIPKETVRRKLIDLVKTGIISKAGKKIEIDRISYQSFKPINTLKNVSYLLSVFSEILESEKIKKNSLSPHQVSILIKQNFSFCWYQYYKFIFSYCLRWREHFGEFEIFLIAMIVVLNRDTLMKKKLILPEQHLEAWRIDFQKSDTVGVNAMSISEITGIPRQTVVRRLKFLIRNNYLDIDKKKLLHVNMSKKHQTEIFKVQDKNLLSISEFISRTFNQISISSNL